MYVMLTSRKGKDLSGEGCSMVELSSSVRELGRFLCMRDLCFSMLNFKGLGLAHSSDLKSPS